MTEQRPSKDQLRLWRQRVETYGGMQLTKPESLALFAEIERLSKPAHERESPHCSTCSCGMQREPPAIAHSVRYDVNGWLCSVCHGWNDQRNTFCVHPHSAAQLNAETTEVCRTCNGTRLTNGRPCEVCSQLRKVPA